MGLTSGYWGSYSKKFQEIMDLILLPKQGSTDLIYPHITSPFYRQSTSTAHYGVDFNYEGGQGALNAAGENAVYSVVNGTVVALQPDWGGVVIQASSDGTLHRILHLETTLVALNQAVISGETQLGTMGGRGEYTKNSDGVSVYYSTGQPVPGNPTYGSDAYAVHVHYDVYLPDADGWQATDQRVDPIVYWTTGLGLTSRALRDIDGNGSPDTSAILEEGKQSLISVELNTPHSQALTIRVEFSSVEASFGGVTFSSPVAGSTLTVDASNPNVAYFTIPRTTNITNHNTLFHFGVTPKDDTNFSSEAIAYSVEAGYRDANGNWIPYQSFAPVTNRTLIVVDNDVLPDADGSVLYGTEGHNTDSFYDPDGDGTNDADPEQGDLLAEKDALGVVVTGAIFGRGGDDVLDGRGKQNIVLNGNAGHDIIHADYDGVNRYYAGQMSAEEMLYALGGSGGKLIGEEGNDILFGGLRDDFIDGGLGNDYAEGRVGNDNINGREGNDWLDGQEGTDVIIGGPDSVTQGTPDSDVLLGGGGSDYLYGGAETDHLYGDSRTRAASWDRQAGGISLLSSDDPNFSGSFPIIKDVDLAEAGDDYLSGGAGADYLYGGAGNDVLDGGDGGDRLEGEGGNDQLFGGEGDDILWGDSDPLTASADAATIMGDYGYYSYYWRDRNVGADGDDLLDGGYGADTLNGGAGSDTYVFGRNYGHDTIQDAAGTDSILLGPGLTYKNVSLVRFESDLRIFINGSSDRLTVSNWFGDVVNQVEFIRFADGTIWDQTFVNSKTGSTLIGTPLVDNLMGTDFSDFILADDSNDLITPGRGNDIALGERGADTYVFNRGDGVDFVEDVATAEEANTIVFGSGIDPASLRLSLGSLVISYGDQGDEIHITNFDPNNIYGPHAIEYFQFADGTQLTYQQLLDRGFDIAGTELDDYLTGTNGIDRITGDAGNDEIRGGAGDDVLEGGDGNDSLLGETGNDTLDGGAGNDYLNGSSGSDTYKFALGHGQDTISDLGGETDRVEFAADVLPTDISVTRYADQVRLTNIATGDRVAIGGWFTGGSAKWQVAFADGTVWDAAAVESRQVATPGTEGDDRIDGTKGDDVLLGLGGNDRLYGYDGNDVLDSGAGNDWLYGGDHHDTYVISRGGGLDVIEASGESYVWWQLGAVEGQSENEVHFGPGISPADLSVTARMVPWIGGTTAFLNIDLGNGDGVEIRGYLYGPEYNIGAYDPLSYPVGLFTFDDGQQMRLTDILAMARPVSVRQYGTGNDDTISGTDQGDGLYGYAGNDTITAGLGDDVLMGAGGDDGLNGGDGNDILIGGTGSDTMDGGTGNDIYIFNPGDSVDRISDSAGIDRVEFEFATTPAVIDVHRSGADLAIKLRSGLAEGTWLLINDGVANNPIEEFFFRQDGSTGTTLTSADILARLTVPTVVGTDANDSLSGTLADEEFYGGLGNDGLSGAGGNDLLSGGDGDDFYAFELGYGVDTIEETSGFDEIRMLGLARADVDIYVKTRGSDLEIHSKDTTDTLIVKNWTSGVSAQVESMRFFGDGTVLTLADLNASDVRGSGGADTLRGSAGNDRLYGDAGNDTLLAKGGNDTLDGGAGNDSLQGDVGNDTYLFRSEWGADTILDNDTTAGNTDTAAFGSSIRPLDLVFSRSGSDLAVTRHGSADSITVQDWYGGSPYHVETFRASEGSVLTSTQVDQLIQAMATFSANNGGITWDQAIDQRPQDVQAIVATYWQVPA